MGGLVILPLAAFILLPFIPETPAWYVSRGKREQAKRSLRKIHQNETDYDTSADLALLEQARELEEEQLRASSWKSLLLDPVERKKLIWAGGGDVCPADLWYYILLQLRCSLCGRDWCFSTFYSHSDHNGFTNHCSGHIRFDSE